jgi:hypothetical protein
VWYGTGHESGEMYDTLAGPARVVFAFRRRVGKAGLDRLALAVVEAMGTGLANPD